MRRLEEQTTYDGWLRDEWQPAMGEHPRTAGMRDEDVTRYVREWNKKAKAEGCNTRLRSVEVDEYGDES